MKKQVFLQTYGCQMNDRDSEEVLGMLTAQGYEVSQKPEDADVILLNTCSVRAHAEGRAFGKMGELSELKAGKPDLVLGIIGCMAKLHEAAIFKRLPKVDLVAGPAELYDLPYLLAEIQERRQKSEVRGQRSEGARIVATGRAYRPLEQKPAGDFRKPGVSAFVTIMEGCDKVCTYCIVPTTRGQEISRPPEDIVNEINMLVRAGYQEVTLLGQNVNSYGKRFPDGSGYRGPLGRLRLLEEDPDTLLDFPQLLRLIDKRTTIPRVRFTTSHPFDATERLFEAIAECDSVCEWLPLPVQSGSNRILRAMRRGYTAEAYLRKVEALRRLVPEIALTTDIIVGFPGETDEDFEATERLVRDVRYESAYIFKYSPRPGTAAAALEDDVPQEVKEARNQRLLAIQEQLTLADHEALAGQEHEILIEAPGRHARQWFGRTRGHHGIIVESDIPLIGQTVRARITQAASHTLFAALLPAAASGRA